MCPRAIVHEISLSPLILRAIFGGLSKKKRLQRLNYLVRPEISKLEIRSIDKNISDNKNNFGLENNLKAGTKVGDHKVTGLARDPNSYKWDKFKLEIKKLDEPLLVSIFQQVQFAKFKLELNLVSIDLDQNLSFFKDIIQDQRLVWLPKLQAVFGEHMSLEINLVHQAALPELIVPVVNSSAVGAGVADLGNIVFDNIASGAVENLNSNLSNNNKLIKIAAGSVASVSSNLNNSGAVSKYTNKTLDFANQARWPKVKLVLDFFPGTLSEISE